MCCAERQNPLQAGNVKLAEYFQPTNRVIINYVTVSSQTKYCYSSFTADKDETT